MRDNIFKIIDTFTEGVDTYYHNGSMWLILTDENKWVIELTKEGTLWYNFYFFQDWFKYVSLDVVENQHYITEWVESIIQNGVKSTASSIFLFPPPVESIIQKGIKRTELSTAGIPFKKKKSKEVIQNGVKETRGLGPSEVTEKEINKVIKETHEDVYDHNGRVGGVIKNGIKETIELPDKSGELNGYGEYYARQKNKTYPHTDIVNDVIKEGNSYKIIDNFTEGVTI